MMKMKDVILFAILRVLEVVVILAVFWLIGYLVAEYINPLPDLTGRNKSYPSFGLDAAIRQQQFDIMFFRCMFGFAIISYYGLLYSAKQKRIGDRKDGVERIKAYRKTIFGRTTSLAILLIPLLVVSLIVGSTMNDAVIRFMGFIAPVYFLLAFGPWIIFHGISKAFTLAFCLKFMLMIVAILSIFILLNIPPYFAYIASSIPIVLEYSLRLSKAWDSLSLLTDQTDSEPL